MIATGLVNDIAFRHLPMGRARATVLAQFLFLALALIIPTLTHRLGLNYLVAQPMHWMILFAGLSYGPVSGLLLGLGVPIASFLVTGMPVPAMLPLMLPELAAYGLLAGLLKPRLSAFGSVAVALVAGRLVFLALLALSGSLSGSPLGFAQATWLPGLPVMLMQICLLPVLTGLYVKWAGKE